MKGFEAVVRATARMFHREPWWAEFWSAVTVVAWALLAFAVLHPLAASPSMHVLLAFAPGDVWRDVGVALGIAQLLFLMADSRVLRWGAAVVACCFWGMLTMGVWAAEPWSPVVAVYGVWCGVNMLSVLRLLRAYG